jgi:hypothetical protein
MSEARQARSLSAVGFFLGLASLKDSARDRATKAAGSRRCIAALEAVG